MRQALLLLMIFTANTVLAFEAPTLEAIKQVTNAKTSKAVGVLRKLSPKKRQGAIRNLIKGKQSEPYSNMVLVLMGELSSASGDPAKVKGMLEKYMQSKNADLRTLTSQQVALELQAVIAILEKYRLLASSALALSDRVLKPVLQNPNVGSPERFYVLSSLIEALERVGGFEISSSIAEEGPGFFSRKELRYELQLVTAQARSLMRLGKIDESLKVLEDRLAQDDVKKRFSTEIMRMQLLKYSVVNIKNDWEKSKQSEIYLDEKFRSVSDKGLKREYKVLLTLKELHKGNYMKTKTVAEGFITKAKDKVRPHYLLARSLRYLKAWDQLDKLWSDLGSKPEDNYDDFLYVYFAVERSLQNWRKKQPIAPIVERVKAMRLAPEVYSVYMKPIEMLARAQKDGLEKSGIKKHLSTLSQHFWLRKDIEFVIAQNS